MVEWAYNANALLFGAMTLAFMDPFGSDDDDRDDTPEGPDGMRIIGNAEDNLIEGGPRDDVLLGMEGDDTIHGHDGDDIIEGNTGNDLLYGGAGHDLIAGGGGTDTIHGGPGNDTISADRLDGDADWTRGGQEHLFGDDGDDHLIFSTDDIVAGDSGRDSFAMVTDMAGGPAHVADYDLNEDSLAFYADFDPQNLPEIIVRLDDETNLTSVFLGERLTMTLTGGFTAEQLGITLRHSSLVFADAGLPG